MKINNSVSPMRVPVSESQAVTPGGAGTGPAVSLVSGMQPLGTASAVLSVHGLTGPPALPDSLAIRDRFNERNLIDSFRGRRTDLMATAPSGNHAERIDRMFSVLGQLRDAEGEALLKSQIEREV